MIMCSKAAEAEEHKAAEGAVIWELCETCPNISPPAAFVFTPEAAETAGKPSRGWAGSACSQLCITMLDFTLPLSELLEILDE